jgi:glycerol-3-phosphate dehydrogenase
VQQPSVRDQAWKQLQEREFDLIVIGGGVLGAATARDAALRGLRVALIEANDIASGTSSKSSKLIHGGFRYLEQGELSLVFESVSERQVMMKVAPHLVRPLGFLFPIYKDDPVRLATLRLGLMVYEGLALFRSPKLHRKLDVDEIVKAVPQLRTEGLRGAPLFWDCATDDARITLENVIDATRAGATVLTHARVDELLKGPVARGSGGLRGVRVVDTLSPRQVEVSGKVMINATGPWADRTRSLSRPSHQLRLTKGVHIVIPAHRVPIPHTIVAFHPRDHRVLFIIPWGDQVYIGTTDTDYEGDPALVRATRADVDYLLEALHAYMPSVAVKPEEITATWAGLRALIRAEGVPPSQVSREHVITEDPEGLITIAGGKLTTHRRMGIEVVDHALKWLRSSGRGHSPVKSIDSAQLPLPGAANWPEDDDGKIVAGQVDVAAGGRLPPQTCRYLADRYGTLAVPLVKEALADERLLAPLVPGRPEILGQVDWAVRHELAATVTDFMERRTQLFFRDAQQGLSAVPVVAERMGKLLGWTDAQREESVREYQEEVARSRAWRTEASTS